MSRNSPRRISRLGIVMALLVLTLGVASALAWQAHQAARSHREAAERVLQDYAEFAAWQFSRAARQGLDASLAQWLGIVACSVQTGRLPAPSGLTMGGLDARALFVVEADRTLTSTGEPLDDEARAAILAAVQPSIDPGRRSGHRVVRVVQLAGRPAILAAHAVRRSPASPPAAAGFVADLDVLERPLSMVMRNSPLLPPTLTSGAGELVGVRVRTDGGVPVFESRLAEDAVRAAGTLTDAVGGLHYEVSLSRAAAGALVIGGLPRSRLPLLVGLLALTAGLLVVAALQLRREHELTRLRSDFVSSVSHELRTPLAQIRLFSETLLLGRVRSGREARRSLEIIQQESQRLAHLVENVLYFSRGERGAGRLAPVPARLGGIVTELVEAFAPLARAGDSDVRVDVREDVVAPVDGGAIRQILLNLLDNAVKYGRTGQTILVTLDRREGMAVIAVEDEGPGVPADARGRIWAPYSRLAEAADSAVAGTGIGLAVVRDLTALHGGACRVESGARGGARFVVEIPHAAAVADLAHAS